MHAEEPQRESGSEPGPSPPPGEAGLNHSKGAGVRGGLRLPLWLLTVGAGLIAGLLAGLGGEAIGKAIPLLVEFPPDYAKMGGYQKDAVRAMAVGKAEKVVERKKATEEYGLLGLLLGLSLGLTGGLAAGSPRSGFMGAAIGATIGAAAGAGISWAVVPLFFRYQDPESGGLLGLFITHAGIFAGVGAAAGLALGIGLGDRPALGSCPLRRVAGGARRNLRLRDCLFPRIPLDAHLPARSCRTTPASSGASVRRDLHVLHGRAGGRHTAQGEAKIVRS